MEPEAAQAGRVPQRTPGAVPLCRRIGRVLVVVLARAPEIMLRVRVRKFVRALEHPRDGIAAAPFNGILRLLVSFLLCPT